MKKINQKSFSLLIVLVVFIVVISASYLIYFKFNKKPVIVENNNKNILIGFSITTLQEERWQKDKLEFMKKAEEMGVTVDFQTAQNNVQNQISQIDRMIVNGEDIIVVVPYKSDTLTDVVNRAHKAGIKVISYDRLINNANTDLYVSFDNEKVGEYQAQYIIDALSDKINNGIKVKIAYVGGSPDDNNSQILKKGAFNILQPLIDSGKIEIVYNNFTTDWNPDTAYKNIKNYLSKNNGKIDAVIAANDGTAFGSITALKEYGLDGKVPVSGQDSELAALQRIVEGTQTMTVYKPINKLASSVVELALELIKGASLGNTKIVNDGQFDIPSVLLDPVLVNKENMNDTIIKDGYHTENEIYNK